MDASSSKRLGMRASLALSGAALALSLVALLREPSPAGPEEAPGLSDANSAAAALAPPASSGELSQARLQRLEDRLRALEQRPEGVARREAPSPQPELSAPVVEGWSASQRRAFEERLARLELRASAADGVARELADPQAIPARLAVLLASRGVVTEIGDIEAIRQNAGVLVTLVGDGRAQDWDRLEAYRGLLMFQTDEEARAARGGLLDLLDSSLEVEVEVRKRCLALVSNFMDADLAPRLESSFFRESDSEVRGAIVSRLAQCVEDARARQALESIAQRCEDEALVLRIVDVLQR